MKKFRFSLETVLDYKNQALDSLRAEHGAILAQVRAQEQVIENLETEHRQVDEEFTQRKLEGLTVLDALNYEQYLRSLEREIHTEYYKLAKLRKQEEAKRAEVVEAKQDTSALEKLREKKLDSYRKAVQKGEEALIEEFVTTAKVMAAQGA